MVVLGFTGHRDWLCAPARLVELASEFPGALWMHGGAPGFDTQVQTFCLETGQVHQIIRPRYHEPPEGMTQARWMKVAPLKRDEEIADRSTLLVACYDGRRTGGTFYTVEYARRCGIPVRIWEPFKRVTKGPYQAVGL